MSDTGTNAPSRDAIEQAMRDLMVEMTSDWDMDFEGEIGMDTKLIGDLAFESIDVVQLVSQIETHYARKDLPFEELLMNDGQYVEDLTLGQVVDFLVGAL